MSTYKFDNGYGASVIDDGYGSSAGLFELAVLHDGHLCYKSGITDDVMGWLSDDDVAAIKDQIKALPATELCDHRMVFTD